MDRKPQRPNFNQQNENMRKNRGEKGMNDAARCEHNGVVQQRPRCTVRYPSDIKRHPQRRKTSMLFRMVVLVVIVALVIALVWIFKAIGGQSGEGTDSGYTKTAPDFSSLGQDNAKIKHILLDAGHGFGDIGCSPDALNGNNEKDITLRAVRMLKSKLEEKGYTVSLTHDGAAFTSAPELTDRLNALGYEYKTEQIIDNNVFSAYERTMWANVLNSEKRFGAFVSLHVNSNDKTSLTGFTIDYCGANEHTQRSEQLSSAIDSALKRDYPQRSCDLFRDTWEDSYIVTKYPMMPSCLVEMGYGSSPDDAALLLDDSWLEALASSIADGIDSYYKG